MGQRWANRLLMVGAMVGYSRFNVVLCLAQRWVMVDRRRYGECWPNGQSTVGPTVAWLVVPTVGQRAGYRWPNGSMHDWLCQRWANCWLMVGAMVGYSRFNVGLWLVQRWVMVAVNVGQSNPILHSIRECCNFVSCFSAIYNIYMS